MPPLHTPTLVRWGRVAVIAAVAIAAVWAFALITPSYELDTEAFLERVYAQRVEVRSVHTTQSGSMTMSNGDVHHSSGEGDIVHTGDSQGYIEYEGCTFPTGLMSKGVRLCGIEWVELEGVRYERRNTSEGPGEWEIVESVQTGSTDSDTPPDPAKVPEYWSRKYGLVELKPETHDGVEYRRFRSFYSPLRRMLERLKAGEWEPPAEIPRELFVADLEEQAEAETGTIELWARADDGVIWKIIQEVETPEVDGRDSLRPPTSIKRYSTMKYSRYNEPVVIKPPIR